MSLTANLKNVKKLLTQYALTSHYFIQKRNCIYFGAAHFAHSKQIQYLLVQPKALRSISPKTIQTEEKVSKSTYKNLVNVTKKDQQIDHDQKSKVSSTSFPSQICLIVQTIVQALFERQESSRCEVQHDRQAWHRSLYLDLSDIKSDKIQQPNFAGLSDKNVQILSKTKAIENSNDYKSKGMICFQFQVIFSYYLIDLSNLKIN